MSNETPEETRGSKIYNISYSKKDGKWARIEFGGDDDPWLAELSSTAQIYQMQMDALRGGTYTEFPISNPEDLKQAGIGEIKISMFEKPKEKLGLLDQLKGFPEIWESAQNKARQVPFKNWAVYLSKLDDNAVYFWTTILRKIDHQI